MSRAKLKAVGAGHKVGFTVQLHHASHLGPSMNIGANHTFICITARLLGGGGKPLFAENFYRCLKIAVGFRQGFFAIQHASASCLAQFLDHLRTNLSHCFLSNLEKYRFLVLQSWCL
jgi:hypothetical protein